MDNININPYIKTNWVDHIVDIEYGEVIQEGTRFTATRANNIEEGIWTSHERLAGYYDEIVKLRIQLEMIGRVPINNGTFFDPIDEDGNTKALRLLKESTVSQTSLSVGATEITLDKVPEFTVGEYITIYDEENFEDLKVISIADKVVTVAALTKPSKKGAVVSRSNMVVKGSKLVYGQWGNYSVAISEVI